MTDDPDMPGSTPEEQEQAESHEQFQKLADLARKATEDHITTLVEASLAPALDDYNIGFAVICGVASGMVTALVGLGDRFGDDAAAQAQELNKVVAQQASVFNEIQNRKALLAATDGGTQQ